MANINAIRENGANLIVYFDDSSSAMALYTGSGTWFVETSTSPDPDPEPGGWQHPLGGSWPTGTWTTYSGEPSHDAGAVDFGAGYGGEPPLYAPCNGTVILAGRWGIESPHGTGQSLTVIIKPTGENVGITYLHMNRIDVSVGQTVTTGQQVGIVGWTGYTEPPGPGGAHLHLEVRTNGVDWGPWIPAVSYFASKGVTL